MAYKIKQRYNFFLLKSNHQCSEVNRIYGFYDQCKRKFNLKLWRNICATFDWLPIAAVIGNRIFCVHGGLSPQLRNIKDLNDIKDLQNHIKPQLCVICYGLIHLQILIFGVIMLIEVLVFILQVYRYQILKERKNERKLTMVQKSKESF